MKRYIEVGRQRERGYDRGMQIMMMDVCRKENGVRNGQEQWINEDEDNGGMQRKRIKLCRERGLRYVEKKD